MQIIILRKWKNLYGERELMSTNVYYGSSTIWHNLQISTEFWVSVTWIYDLNLPRANSHMAVWTWTNYSTSLSFGVFICKMKLHAWLIVVLRWMSISRRLWTVRDDKKGQYFLWFFYLLTILLYIVDISKSVQIIRLHCFLFFSKSICNLPGISVRTSLLWGLKLYMQVDW